MKRLFAGAVAGYLLLILCGCSMGTISEEKLRDIEITVVPEENLPEELLEQIEERKKEVFRITYADQGELFIAEGYGTQNSSGYSIEVAECYETENTICIRTDLIGPSYGEEIVETETCPYIVVKMEYIDKNVVFQ